MVIYIVEVVIENKKAARDPEGETIQKDLIYRSGYDSIKSVRSGKYLRIEIESDTPESAEKRVFEMCNELRIFNPVVHTCKIKVLNE